MTRHLHFISGLPRSGSTLLSGILRQNPAFHAHVESPLFDVIRASIQTMSASECAGFISDDQRRSVIRGVLCGYYEHIANKTTIFDSNRGWCAQLAMVASVSPQSRVICCVRNPSWILDSVERLVHANPLRYSRIFGHQATNVFGRVEVLSTKQLLAPSLNAFKQAWFSEEANRLIVIRYESLVATPRHVMTQLYDLINQPIFDHMFGSIEFDEPAFDEYLGMPGMHRLSGPVAPRPRRTILPEELFKQHDNAFWDQSASNPRNVVVL